MIFLEHKDGRKQRFEAKGGAAAGEKNEEERGGRKNFVNKKDRIGEKSEGREKEHLKQGATKNKPRARLNKGGEATR